MTILGSINTLYSPLHKLLSLIHEWTLTLQSPVHLVWALGMGPVKQTQESGRVSEFAQHQFCEPI